MSKDQTTTDSTTTGTEVIKRKPLCLVEVLGANTRAMAPDAIVRLSAPGQAAVDMSAEKHANNISKSLAKSAGRLAYRLACVHAGFADPEAK